MKLTKTQLKQIIREELEAIAGDESTMSGGNTLFATPTVYGGMFVEDSAGNDLRIATMIKTLLDAEIQEFTSEEGLKRMLKADAQGIQGGMEKWDSDVFSGYYDVHLERVVQLYAQQKGMQYEIGDIE